MIPLNEKISLPPAVKWYTISKLLILLAIITITFSFIKSGLVVFWIFGIFVVAPFSIYFFIYYALFSFIVDESKLTINSGIIIRRSKSIPFTNIQNVDNVVGLWARLFGLTRVAVWTASASQIEIRNENSDNRPDGILLLKISEGNWLKDYILNKKY